MATTRRTWQMFEQRVAAFFGTRRKPLSGGGSGGSHSDSQHEQLFIEAKLRAKSPVHRLFAVVEKHAAAEGKTPLLALQEKNHVGWLLVCRPEDIHLLSSLARNYKSLPDAVIEERESDHE
jgi:hypothetical protein